MIKLGGLIDLRPQWLGEAEDDKYVSIGFGRYKQKGKEDDDNAPTFKKDDSGKYVPTGDKAAKGGDSSAEKDTPKVNIFDKPKKDKEAPKKDKKSDAPKLSIDTDDMGDYDGMSSDTSSEVEDYLNKELGLDGSSDINNNGAIEYNIPGSTDTLYIGNDERTGKKFSVSLADEDGNSNDTYKAFDNDADAMAYAKELGQKLKGGAGDTPKSEPKSDTPKEEPSKYDSEYFADDEKEDDNYLVHPDTDDYDDVDDEGTEGVRKTEERLDKIEKALEDELKLDDNGFRTSRSSSGGMGSWEGPLEIYDENAVDADGVGKDGAVTLSIGSGENDGNFSIGFTDFDGMEVFDGGYSINGNEDLSAEESFKLGKTLMKMPEVQKFLKGKISKDKFKPIFDKIKSKFSGKKPKNESSTKLRDLLPEKFTATSKETGTVSVFKTKDARDAAVKAGTHEKRKDDKDGDDKKDTPKVNIFDKPKKDKKSEPKSDSSEKAPRDDKNRIIVPKELELKGDVFNDDWYQKKFAWIKTKEEQDFITDLIKKSSPQVVNKLSRDPEKLRAAIQKQIDKKKNEPSTDSANSRPGNPEINKAVREKTQDLGITPQKLGKEEYESRMKKAAVEALVDSNFHSEARKLISVLEDKPEWAKDPNQDPNKPDIFSPEYEEWQKTSVYSSELYDSAEGTDEIAHEASNQAGWDGVAALDAIAFDLKMNGSKKLAAKIQGIIDDTNESSIRLTKMEWRK